MVGGMVVEHERERGQGVELGLRNLAGLVHLLEHGVTIEGECVRCDGAG